VLKKLSIVCVLLFSTHLSAEVVTDGSVGPPGTTLPGPEFLITEDFGQQEGSNLFHSFETFNLNMGESATFFGHDSVANIVSRVTGGNPSEINGLIRSTIPNADMYFLNPYGIMFGSNAALDVQGSFHASTAHYLRLGENDHFYSDLGNESVLSVASPTAFGFLEQPAPIHVQGSFLEAPMLSLIGGDISIEDGILFAGSGRINLASAVSKGEVIVSQDDLKVTSIEQGIINIVQTEYEMPLGEMPPSFETNNPEMVAGEMPPSDIEGTAMFEGEMPPFSDNSIPGNLDVSDIGNGIGQVFIRAGQLNLDNAWILADTFGEPRMQNGLIDVLVKNNIESKDSLFFASYGSTINLTAANMQMKDSTILTPAGQVNLKAEGGIINISDNIGDTINISVNPDRMRNILDKRPAFRKLSLLLKKRENSTSPEKIYALQEQLLTEINSPSELDKQIINRFSQDENIGNIDTSGPGGGQVVIRAGQFFLDSGSIYADNYGGFDGGGIDIKIEGKMRLTNSARITAWTTTHDFDKDVRGGNISIEADKLEMSGISKEKIRSFVLQNMQLVKFFVNEEETEKFVNSLQEILWDLDEQGIQEISANQMVEKMDEIYAEIIPGIFYNLSPPNVNDNNISAMPVLPLDQIREMPREFFKQFFVDNLEAQNFADNLQDLLAQNDEISLDRIVDIVSNKEYAEPIEQFFIETLFNTIATTNSGEGMGGNVEIDISTLNTDHALIETATRNNGASGDIDIDASQIQLDNYSLISAFTEEGAGKAGDIEIDAEDSISLSNYSSIFASASEKSTGQAGNINLNTKDLTLNLGQINSVSEGKGNAGLLNISANTALLTNGSGIFTEADNASGGNINFNVRDRLYVNDNSWVSAKTLGGEKQDSGGNITIQNPKIFILDKSKILAGAEEGDGGNITINARHFIPSYPFGKFGKIESQVDFGELFPEGDEKFSLKRITRIDASSKAGRDGEVWINASEEDISKNLVLSDNLLPEQQLSLNRCALSMKGFDSFFIISRDIPPSSPIDLR
jgi:filamentous hemagglutinin family protein